MTVRQYCCASLMAVMLFLPGFSDTVSAEAKKLKMGIVPQQSASRLAMVWTPLLSELSKSLGVEIIFTAAKNIPTFEECLAEGVYDLAYMNPYHYSEFSWYFGYVAFAHQRGKKLKGILVTRQGSSIKALSDLDGAKIAFPSPAAFGASILPRAEIRELGIQIEPNYVKSHDSVYRAVATGIFPAGGGIMRTFGVIPEDLRSQLRIFYETKEYTPHAFAAHPRIAPDLVKKIADQMAAMDSDSETMKNLGMRGITLAKDDAWNDVRMLYLAQSETQIREAASQCHSN